MSTLPRDQILIGDCIASMRGLPEKSVDLVFADPPYNLQLGGELLRPDNSRVNGVDAQWDKLGDFKAHDAFSAEWLGAARRVLKDDGAIWVIGTYHNIFRLGALLQDLGYWLLNDVIWRKNNPMPNFRGTRFTNAHETLIWAAKHKDSRYTFNYRAMKTGNDGVQMRSDWLLPICTGSERLKVAGRKLHPTQKPEGLLHRILLATTRPGETVLDPFFGTGTTGAVAKRLSRHFIGLERDEDYATAAAIRIAGVVPVPARAMAVSSEQRDEVKIPFGSLVAAGAVPPGTLLRDGSQRFEAVVQADGSLQAREHCGSIHQVAAALQGRPSGNGWLFWWFDGASGPVQLDDLRQQARRDISAQVDIVKTPTVGGCGGEGHSLSGAA